MAKKLSIDVWSDIVCPWCAIGKRRLESALARFPHQRDVVLTWRSFELDPSAPVLQREDNATHLAHKYGRTKAQAEEMIQRVTDTAAAEGLTFDLVHARSGNTFDAHRLLHLAAEHGLQDALKTRLFGAYMSETQAIGDRPVLERVAAEVGLDVAEVRSTLESDRFAQDVRDEEEAARRMGITGVPFFVLGGRLGVAGAQPVDVLLRALTQAWESAPEIDEPAEGASCAPDGCAMER